LFCLPEDSRGGPAYDPDAYDPDMMLTETRAAARNGELRRASNQGEAERVAQLLEQGADPNSHNRFGSTALHLAARHGHLPVVDLLLAHGAAASRRDNHGNTPAVLAAWGVHREVLSTLLERAADLPELEKEICLAWAIILADVPTVELLLRAGADPDVRGHRGWTAKEFARHWYRTGRQGPYEEQYREILTLLGLPEE
jgi:ankyrin repeat protein